MGVADGTVVVEDGYLDAVVAGSAPARLLPSHIAEISHGDVSSFHLLGQLRDKGQAVVGIECLATERVVQITQQSHDVLIVY